MIRTYQANTEILLIRRYYRKCGDINRKCYRGRRSEIVEAIGDTCLYCRLETGDADVDTIGDRIGDAIDDIVDIN